MKNIKNGLIDLGMITKRENVLVSSRTIAENFNKRHGDVLEGISTLLSQISTTENTVLFIESSYKASNGKNNKEYLLTRDGFSLLVMGFTGAKSLDWKLKYIQAFNEMEHFIIEKHSTEWKETRIKGKLTRKDETDIILTKLIPLAELQGSKNANKMYVTYSKLVNKCVGVPPRSRDKVNSRVLDVMNSLENLIENIIIEESIKGTHYKEIYQICKTKCNLLVELSYLPSQKLIG